MVLAVQFNSFVHPIPVMVALPFTVTGAFLSLLITHQSINLYSHHRAFWCSWASH